MNELIRNRYLERLSTTFYEFRETNLLCDTILVTTDRELLAHSLVLAAASSVFRDAFQTSSCDANGCHRLELPEISGSIMESVLFLIYTGSLRASDRSILNNSSLIETCERLGINSTSGKSTEIRNLEDQHDTDVPLILQLNDLSDDEDDGEDGDTETDDSKHGVVTMNNQNVDQSKFDSNFLNLNMDVVMELCSDKLENEEINRLIAVDEDIATNPFVCDICMERFATGLALRNHRRCIHCCLECVDCGLCFDSETALCRHLSQNCQWIVVRCNLCAVECTGRQSLADHVAVHHDASPTCASCRQPFADSRCVELHHPVHASQPSLHTTQCTCGRHFNSINDFEEHRMTSHACSATTTGMLFCCCACGRTIDDEVELRKHLSTHGLSGADVVRQVKGGNNMEQHVCFDCGRSYAHASLLKIHRRTHTGERPFVCEICGLRFKDNCLQKHMLIHKDGPRPFACADCPKTFSRVSDLQAHVRRHTGEMGYDCSECGRQFRKKNTLQRHLRVHTGERPYVCETCGKSFKIMFHLQLHRSIHLTERAFQCSVCEKAFQSAVRLKKHQVVHTGVKPYSCPICERAFNRNANMRAHMKVHVSRRQRDNTGVDKNFELSLVDDDAMAGETPTMTSSRHHQLHACGQCGSTFSRLSTLKAHARTHRETTIVNDVIPGSGSSVEVVYCKVEDQSDSFIALPMSVQYSEDDGLGGAGFVC